MAQVTINTPRETTHQRIADALEGIVGKITDTSKSSNIDYDNSTSKLTAVKVQDAIDELASEKVDKVNGKGLSTNDYTTAEKNKLSGITDGAEVNVQSNWSETNVNSDAYIKNKPSVYTKTEVDNKFSAFETNIDWKEAVATYNDIATTYPNPQDGWTVNVKDTDYTYRYNGTAWVVISANAIPNATTSVNGLMTTTQVTKLDGIQSGAEVNVQSDWNETNTNSDSYIKNKPNIYNKTEVDTALSNKVDKVSGKGLSTNDYTNADKQKVASIKDDDISSNITGTKEVTVTDSTKAPIIAFKGNGYTKQDGTPTPDNPIPIQGYGDMGWFDGELVQGSATDTDPTYVTTKTYIECSTSDNLKIVTELDYQYIFIYCYDKDKNALQRQTYRDDYKDITFSLPTSTKYIKITFGYITSGTTNVTPSTAGHITVLKNNMYCAPVKSVGKNLFNPAFEETTAKQGIVRTDNNDGTFSVKGTNTYSGEIYFISQVNINTTNSVKLVGCPKTNDACLQIYYNDAWQQDKRDFGDGVILENGSLLKGIAIVVKKGATVNLLFKPMITEDLSATYDDFEPYTESTALIPTSQPFYQGDYIQLNADGSGVEHRENGVIADGSSMTWMCNTNNKIPLFECSVPIAYEGKWSKTIKAICPKYKAIEVINFPDNNQMATGWGLLYIRDDSFGTDASAFRNSMKGVPIIYKLKTPTDTSLTKEQVTEIKKLMSFNNQTTFSTEPYNSEFEVEYYKNTKNGKVVGGVESKLNEIYQLLSKV